MNTDGKMSYKDFIFPVNPRIIKISHARKINRHNIPFGNDTVSDMGGNSRIITGEGEFYGENCMNDIEKFRAVFESGGGGILYIPSQKPIYAVFASLDIPAQDIENVIKYSFEFIESFEKVSEVKNLSCIADGKSSLWDIAYKYGKYVEELAELNPWILRPDCIIERGSRVILC